MGENAVAAARCPMQVPCYHLQQQQQEQQSAENAATPVGYSMKWRTNLNNVRRMQRRQLGTQCRYPTTIYFSSRNSIDGECSSGGGSVPNAGTLLPTPSAAADGGVLGVTTQGNQGDERFQEQQISACSYQQMMIYNEGVSKKDITKAIELIEIFDFLVDIVLKDEIREEGTGFGPSMLGSTLSGVQNFYPPIGQTVAPSEAMIRRIGTSGVQNFYPPMGQTAPSEVMIRRTIMPRVFPFVYIQRQAWQAAKDNTSASRGRSGQWHINASRGSSGRWQAAEDNINASGGNSGRWQDAEDNINASGGSSAQHNVDGQR
ncbi:hypothetical protein T459_10002 [Capsicum annuum]|uniref:Uncharacterized protein n=1 Tax=Capsicum annuum TaxID=4072 RepID=A0A2G3A118_CAPAN|nr:hypothetical protein T459_10002 [Capsicum annuum]